jgi:hypothetical protein
MVGAIRRLTRTADAAWAEPEVLPRRAVDPASVVAAVDTVRDVLGWRSRWGLDDIVGSAWAGWTGEPTGRSQLQNTQQDRDSCTAGTTFSEAVGTDGASPRRKSLRVAQFRK